MRKYGKFEERSESVTPKPPKVKSLLLQTYLTSLLCLVLCVTMFFGTSYAWFTSEVTNTTNEMYVGTLKVGLYTNGNERLANTDKKLFSNEDIRWEPGYTALETIQVKNEGDLAFKYVLSFTDGALADGGDLQSVAKWFDVWVFNHLNQTYTVPASYSVIEQGNGWTHVGSLDEVLAGKPVLDGNMVTVREDDSASDDNTSNGTVDGVKTTDTYTIALHMNENAPSDVMGQKIQLSVKLVAYQIASEADDFNANYDASLSVASNVKELQEALDQGGTVVLASDISGADSDTVTIKSGTLDGNGKSITYVDMESSERSSVKFNNLTVYESSKLTIRGSAVFTDCVLTNMDVSKLPAGSTVTLNNCTYAGVSIENAVLTATADGNGNVTVSCDNALLAVSSSGLLVLASALG